MLVQWRSKKYLKKTQFYASVPTLSFGKVLYGKKRDGKREKMSAYRRLNVYHMNLEQFQVSSRSNYWCSVLTIALLEQK